MHRLNSLRLLSVILWVSAMVLAAGSDAWAATFTVNSTGNGDDGNTADGICQTTTAGECTLRAAIRQANSVPGADSISFNIPGPGPHIVQPVPDLPTITGPTVIDGYTQPGASPNTNGPGLGSNAVLEIQVDGNGVTNQGLQIQSDSVVRGLAISRFRSQGVILFGANIHIEGNFIGTDATGLVALGNSRAITVLGPDSTIGGTSPGARNVISASIGPDGDVWLNGPNVKRITMQGNFIGTDVTGAHPMPGASGGVKIDGASDCLIGGATAEMRNVISGHGGAGVSVFGTGNRIEGNFIGTDVTGTVALGNVRGVSIFLFNGNVVGGSSPGTGNLIAFNGSGVEVSLGAKQNAILSNRLFSNAGLGIDLLTASFPFQGVTPNDAGDGDTGTNQFQNFPVLTTVTSGGGNTTITGTLNSAANATFRVELFDNTTCDPSGFGEGETFLGATAVLTDGGGNAAFTVTFPTNVAIGHVITATATDAANNTSEFSRCLLVALPPNARPTANAGGPYAIVEGGSVTLAGSGTDPNGDALSFAWDLDNNGTFETAVQNPAFSAVDGPVTHTVTLRVCDPLGLCATAATTVAVSNVPPAVDAGPAQTIVSGQSVTVSATFSDPGIADNPWLYSFDWNDASSDSGSTNFQSAPIVASHPYLVPGDYTVKVCVTDKDGGSGCDTAVVSVLPVPVRIDIKPGSDPNSVNCKNGKEVITVAILSDAGFDATTVDHATVVFEQGRETHTDRGGQPRRHEEDVNGDGRVDLVLHFRQDDTSLSCGSVRGTLRGRTFAGRWIEGTDAVRMIDK